MFNNKIICSYLYVITKYGYPPSPEFTLKYLEEMKSLGFESVELEGIRGEYITQMYNFRERIKTKLDELNLYVPYYCAVLPGLSSPDKNKREKQLDLFEKGCKTAKHFGSLGILDNGPLPPYIFPENIPVVRHYDEDVIASASFPKDLTWKKYWNYIIDTYQTVCSISAEYGLTYQIHPSIGVLSSNTDGFLYFYDAVKKDNLRFNFDTANLFTIKENLSIALRRLSNHIDYIHLSDNRGKKVEHLPPGNGSINWEIFFETLELINFNGNIGLDIGGEESRVEDIDFAYSSSGHWLQNKWNL